MMREGGTERHGVTTRLILYPLLRLLRFLKRGVERLIQDREKVSRSAMIEEPTSSPSVSWIGETARETSTWDPSLHRWLVSCCWSRSP